MTGTVVHFRPDLGYGFIHCNETNKDVFVHHTCIEMDGYRKLEAGQVVEFEIEQGRAGLQAHHVVVVEGKL